MVGEEIDDLDGVADDLTDEDVATAGDVGDANGDVGGRDEDVRVPDYVGINDPEELEVAGIAWGDKELAHGCA